MPLRDSSGGACSLTERTIGGSDRATGVMRYCFLDVGKHVGRIIIILIKAGSFCFQVKDFHK